MAVYRLFPEKDALIYSETPTANTGMDEIVELAGYVDTAGKKKTNRIVVQFSSTEIQDVIANKIGNNNYSASIHLYLADASAVPVNYSVYAYPLSVNWDNGTGKFGDIPINTTGVSWTYRSLGETNPWSTVSFGTGITGSFISGSEGGGTWYTGSVGVNMEASQSHEIYSSHDISINVTNAVKQQHAGTIQNNGFILKIQDDIELITSASVRLKYYSRDTNTIYPPSLNIKWDDSVYSTGSLQVLSTDLTTINVVNNKGQYRGQGKQRFRLAARPKFPNRTFSTSSIYLTNYALPTASYWGIKDEHTEEMYIDFDTKFTKISCDSTGPFFDLYMDGIQPERYYRVLVQTVLDGSTVLVDNNNVFKVVRNG